MLFILTGTIQTGKTRWLEQLVERLTELGVSCCGVLAPGVWVASDDEHADGNGYEKLGIENVLLPDGKRVKFADRMDIAMAAGSYVADSQAGSAQLGWHIYDEAIDEVNAHLTRIRGCTGGRHPGLLIVDELGRLELMHGKGLSEAMRMLDEGPSGGFDAALIVVRDYLADAAEERFADAWGGCERIHPTAEAEARVVRALLGNGR